MDALWGSLQGFPYLGETLAVFSAMVWAVAVILFRISGRTVHPLGLNLFKNILAFSLILMTLLILKKPAFHESTWESYALLLASGFLGIALSDSLFFWSLNILGASLSAIVNCLYSPFIISLSIMFIGERLSPLQLGGVMLIITAVLVVALKKPETSLSGRRLFAGIALGVSAMFSMAVGIVMIKPLLNDSPLLWATLFRMAGGSLALGIMILFHPRRRSIVEPLFDLANWKVMVPGSFLGAYVGLITWMGGMKYTQASVASALGQLNTIFIFILAALFLRERATTWKVLAVLAAFTGAILASRP